jgi:hypothetical protein
MENNKLDARTKQVYLIFFLVILVLTGATYSIVQKWQNETLGYEG